MKLHIIQYSSDKTKTLVETAIYRVSKTHDFVQVALNPIVLAYPPGYRRPPDALGGRDYRGYYDVHPHTELVLITIIFSKEFHQLQSGFNP